MVSVGTLKQTVYDELATVISTHVNDDADTHVVYSEDPHAEQLPAIAFDTTDVERFNDSGKHVVVSGKTYDNQGNLDVLEYAELMRLVVDIDVQAESQTTTDAIYTDLREQFITYVTSLRPNDLHSDLTDINVHEGRNDPRNAYTRGGMVTLDIDYCRFQTFDNFVPIRDVNFSTSEDDFDPNTSVDFTC